MGGRKGKKGVGNGKGERMRKGKGSRRGDEERKGLGEGRRLLRYTLEMNI